MRWVLLGLAALAAALAPLSAEPLRIEAQSGDQSTFQPGPVQVLAGEGLRLRVVGPVVGTVRWWQIVPETGRYYKNANHPWEPRPYEWVGFGQIEYKTVEIESWRGLREVEVKPEECFAGASHSPYYHPVTGSFWLQVEDEHDQRSPGLEQATERGLSPAVFRITVQRDDGYLGCLTGFFNVPGLFGCTPYQSFHYIGVDCADVLVAANRRWRGLSVGEDTNVTGVVDAWAKVASLQIVAGVPKKVLSWTRDVCPGDAIAVRYTPGKAFQHIGALYEDANHNGLFDTADAIIHCGPQALHLSRLRDGGFDGEIVILRPPGKKE